MADWTDYYNSARATSSRNAAQAERDAASRAAIRSANAVKFFEEVLPQLQDEAGRRLSDDEIKFLATRFATTGSLELSGEDKEWAEINKKAIADESLYGPDFSGVTGGVLPKKAKEPPSFLATTAANLIPGAKPVYDALAAKTSEQFLADNTGEVLIPAYVNNSIKNASNEVKQSLQSLLNPTRAIGGAAPFAYQQAIAAGPPSPIDMHTPEFEKAFGDALKEQAAAGKKVAEARARIGEGSFADHATDVAASLIARPEQYLSAAGGFISKGVTALTGGGGLPLSAAIYAATSAPITITTMQEAAGYAYTPVEMGGLGMTADEAMDYGVLKAAIELGTEAVGGKLIEKALGTFGGKRAAGEALDSVVERVVRSRKARIAAASGIEAGEEGIANTLNAGADVMLAGSEAYDRDTTSALVRQADSSLQNYGVNTAKSMIGGGIGGAVMSSPQAMLDYRSEINTRDAIRDASTKLREAAAIAEANRRADEAAEAAARRGEQGELFPAGDESTSTFEEQEAARQQQYQRQYEEDAAWDQRNKEREEELRIQQERDLLARKVDRARGEMEPLQDAIEDGATDNATLNRAAAASRKLKEAEDALAAFDASLAQESPQVAPQPVAETTQQEVPTPVQQELTLTENPRTVQATSDLLSAKERLEAIAAKEKEAKDKAEAKRRADLALQVAREHGDKSLEEQGRILADLQDDPTVQPVPSGKPSKPVKTLEEKVQGVINQVEGLRKRGNSGRVAAKIRDLYRKDPTRTAKDIAAILDNLEGVETTSTPTEQQIREEHAKRKGRTLSMDGQAAAQQEAAASPDGRPVPRTAEKQKQHEANVATLLKALGNTQENVDIFNLVHQGKLILTDRAETVGRKATADPAQYDIDDKKMYVYLDNFDPSKGKEVMLQAAAQHESGHAGQFNQRDGRNNIFRNLLGDKGNAAANKTIRDAAKKGNKLAQAAVDRATEAAKNNNDFTNVEDLELVPHLFSEAKIGEHAPGTVGKVIRDVKNAARGVTRKLFNKELNYSVDELAAAGSMVPGEIVKTDLRPETGRSGTLSMEAGRGAKNYAAAKAAGETWTDKIDGLDRFEFSDTEAEINPDAGFWRNLHRTGATVPLRDAITHGLLDENYADLFSDLTITVDKNLPLTTYGTYRNKKISLSSLAAMFADREVTRNTILHEIQHAIQAYEGFVDGTNPEAFIPSSIKGMKEFDESAVTTRAKRFDLGAAVQSLTPAGKAKWNALTKDRFYLSRDQLAVLMANSDMTTSITDRNAVRQLEHLKSAVDNLEKSKADYAEAERLAMKIYMADRGEAGARATELRSRMTDLERKMTHYRDSLGADSETIKTFGRRLSEDELIDSRKYRRAPTRASVSEQPAAAAIATTTPTQISTTSSDDRSDRYNDFIDAALRRKLMEARGEEILDDIIYSNLSPNTIAKKFWRETYFRLPAYVQDTFQKLLRDHTGMSPGDALYRDTDGTLVLAQDWLDIADNGTDLPNDAEYLEGTDRGFVVLMHEANSRAEVPKEARRQSPSLAMSATQNSPKSKRKPKFSVKERIARIISHGSNSSMAGVKKAEDLHSQFVDALRSDQGSGRFANPTLTPEADSAFGAFLVDSRHGTVEGRAEVTAELKKQFPATADVLLQIRDSITDLTMDIVDNMLVEGGTLTNAALKSIQTLDANKDVYMSRSYSAFQGREGRKWAQTRWANYYQNIGKALTSIKNDKVRADVADVRNAIKDIVASIRIPDIAVLHDLPMKSLESLAARHAINDNILRYDRADPDATWLKRDELISKLEERGKSMPEGRLEDMAMGEAKALLGLSGKASGYAKQTADLMRNPGTLIKREHVPLSIRKMLGELEVTPAKFLATMHNNAALRARTAVQAELLSEENGDIVISEDDFYALPKASETKTGKVVSRLSPFRNPNQGDYVKVEGSEWGVLEGKYMRREAAARLDETAKAFTSFWEAVDEGITSIAFAKKVGGGILKATGAVNRWTKLPTVVWNPTNYIAQHVGSYMNIIGEGNLPFNFVGAGVGKGLKTAGSYFAGVWNTTTTPDLSEVQEHVRLEAADIADIQNVLGAKIADYFDSPAKMAEAGIKIREAATGWVARGHKTSVAAYAIADNWSKIANFYHRFAVLDAVNKAAGSPKSRKQVLREAGDDTTYTNISPERVAQIIAGGESIGGTQYAPYFAEVFRTRVTGYALAVKDRIEASRLYDEGHHEAANILARAAVARFIGHTIATVGMPLVGTMKLASRLAAVGVPAGIAIAFANSVNSLGGDDEDMKAKRRLLPESLRYQEIMQAGVNDKGFPVFWGSSQKIDPVGPAADTMRIVAYADNDVTAANNLDKYLTENLFIFPQVWKDMYKGFVNDSVPESDIGKALDIVGAKSAFVNATGVRGETLDRYLNVLDNAVPGFMRAWKDTYSADKIQADPTTKKILKGLNLLGFRFEEVDLATALQPYSRVSEDTALKAKGDLYSDLLDIASPSKSNVEEALRRYATAEIARMAEDHRNVESLRAWKLDDDAAVKTLVEGGYTKKYAEQLVDGSTAITLPLSGLYSYATRKQQYMSGGGREAHKARVIAMAEAIKDMESELNEMGIKLDMKRIPKEWRE